MDLQDFHHPFTPYEIQLQFMRGLYGSLEDGKVAIFESPTGKRTTPVSWARSNVGAGTVSVPLGSPVSSLHRQVIVRVIRTRRDALGIGGIQSIRA